MSRTVKTFVLGGTIALVGVFAGACSSDADVGLPAGGEPTAGGSPSGVEQTASPTTSASDDGAGNADVTATSFEFQPAEITVEQGEDLRVANIDATVDHTFTIEGTEIDEIIPAGEDATVRADLQAGSYTVICRFHAEQGMEASLEVG
jgi:plastocyanin